MHTAGTEHGYTLGTPIGLLVKNEDQVWAAPPVHAMALPAHCLPASPLLAFAAPGRLQRNE